MIYYHYYEHPGGHNVARHCGVTSGTHKLIYFYHLDEWELFDLEKDPDELTSVYDDPEYATIRKELTEELARLQDHYDVPEDPRDDVEMARAATHREIQIKLYKEGRNGTDPTWKRPEGKEIRAMVEEVLRE